MAVNHLVFQGRLVDVPVFGQTNTGNDYANFRLAWSEKFKDKEAKCFLECKAFREKATLMKNYMNQKGQEISVEGKLNTESWEKDGQKRSKIVLIVNDVHFCGKRQDIQEQSESSTPAVQTNTTEVETDGLPF